MKALIERLSFAAGAAGKRLHARLDLARAQIAVAKCENMVVLLEGGLTRRPGTRFVSEQQNETQKAELVPFRYSPTDNYMIAINGGKARLLYGGGTVELTAGVPFEIQLPYAEADLSKLRWSQDGNQMHLACEGLQTRVLTRAAHTSWTVANYTSTYGPFDLQNLDQAKTIKASAETGSVTLTAVGHAPFTSDDIGTLWRLDESDLSLIASWKANEAVSGKFALGALRRWQGNVYQLISGTNSGVNAPIHTEGDVQADGDGQAVWRFVHGDFGIARITAITSPSIAQAVVVVHLPRSATVTAPYRWWAPSWSQARGWPRGVTRYQQRLMLWRQAYFWLSTTADVSNHQQGNEDDQAISGRLHSPDGSLVDLEWMVGSGVLVAGSRDNIWALRSSNVVDALTVKNIRPIPEAAEGSASHVPAVVDDGALFIGRSRKRLHFVKFDRTAEAVEIKEVTISNRELLAGLASHLAFQRDPNRVCWIGCQDGSLVGCTFMPEQQMIGLHVHPLENGYVESVRSLPANDEGQSEVYMSVRRIINGETRRYYEKLQDFFEPLDPDVPTAAGAWFLDCAIQYQGAATKTIGGLSHLEGQSVNVFASGAFVARDKIVTAASITIDVSVTDAIIGLPIAYRVRSLPEEFPASGSSKSGDKEKTAAQMLVRVVESYGGKIKVNDGPNEALFRSGLQSPGPVALKSGKIKPTVDTPHDLDLVWEISGDDPYPFTLVGCGPLADAEPGQEGD